MDVLIERVFFPLIITAIPVLLGWVVRLLKQADKDRRANAEASRALLYDKLKYLCEKHIREGCLCMEDRKNLECLYQAYRDLDGNGFITGIYERAKKLPLENYLSERI